MIEGTKHVNCAASCRNAPQLAKSSAAASSSLQRVGEGRGAVERHAQPVVELAKISVGDEVACVKGGVELTRFQLEGVEQDHDEVAASRRDALLRAREARGDRNGGFQRDGLAGVSRPQIGESDWPAARGGGKR